MIKKRLKCPKCGKVLCEGYSPRIISITCPCGHVIYLKKREQKDTTVSDIVERFL